MPPTKETTQEISHPAVPAEIAADEYAKEHEYDPGQTYEERIKQFERGEVEIPESEEPPADQPEAEEEPEAEPEAEEEPEAELEGEEEPEQHEEEEAPEEEPEEEPEGEIEAVTLSLPGRREGDPDVEVEFAGLRQEEAEAIARMRNGYLRGEEYRARMSELSSRESRLAEIVGTLESDPANFVLTQMDDDARLALVETVLARLPAEQFDAVGNRIAALIDDPRERELRGLKAERELAARASEIQARRDKMAEARASLDRINDYVGRATDDLSPERAKIVRDQALRTLEEHCVKNMLNTIPSGDLPRLLAPIFRAFDMQAPEIDEGASTGDDPVPAARSERPAVRPKRQDPRSTSETVKRRVARRRKAVSSPPGAGPGPTRFAAKKGETWEERLARYEKEGRA